jgi:selenocysteine-specific elongation factor
MFVIGTAGHVDHGKSTLVTALTGIDPDRLQEEKERGLTIVLGFAWLTLPSGRNVSVVDVPGHERFVRNMLAGVGAIDLALLVVAGDEGVMPQTREHLAILSLLKIRRGLVVLTKMDLVDNEWLELVQSDVEETLKGTSLEGAPILSLSAKTGEGIAELKQTIDTLLTQMEPRKDLGRPRLGVDRIFSVAGFGTVVTGTLIDGSLSIGQEVELIPSGKRARIRGLESHKKKVEEAPPGSRVAVNLSGVSGHEIVRGDVLVTPKWLRPTTAVDVRMQIIPASPTPVRHNMSVTFHSGVAERLAKIRLLETPELKPGEEGWAQIRLDSPVAVAKSDYFVIRSHSNTLGGGTIVDPYAKRHKRGHAPTLDRLHVMEMGTPGEVLLKALEITGPCTLQQILSQTNLSALDARLLAEQEAQASRLVALGGEQIKPSSVLFTTLSWNQASKRTTDILDVYHRQNPLRQGMPREELRSRLALDSQVFAAVIKRFSEEETIVDEGTSLRAPTHKIQLSSVQVQDIEKYLHSLAQHPYSPPNDLAFSQDLLNILISEGRVVKVSADVIFTASAYKDMMCRIKRHIETKGSITVAEVRDLFNTTRKYALPLLEYLDQQRITRRIGDQRVLR